MYKIAIIALFLSFPAVAQKTFPAIQGYGAVFGVQEAEALINVNQKYKIVVDITQGEKNPTKDLNKGYESVARLYNLYALAGLKKGNLDIAVVIHFEATPTILSDEAFQYEFQSANPNTQIINTLGEAGVKFYVCGQSLRARKYVEHKKNQHIKVAHGALLALSHFQSQGYSLIKL